MINGKSLDFTLKQIDEARNYFLEKTKQRNLTSKNRRKVCTNLNNIEHLLIFVINITRCVSVSAANSLAELRSCSITAGNKKHS